MKLHICAIFLFMCFYELCASEIGEFEEYNSERGGILDGVYRGKNLGDIRNTNNENLFEKRFGYNEGKEGGYTFHFDAGNPDIHGEIIRPCQVYDTFCIRKFFGEHSHCKASGRAVPKQPFRAQGNFNYPHVNMSLSEIGAIYSGIDNGRVEEFYINKATDNLVIALGFESVSKTVNNTVMKYYLRGREPAVTNDFSYLQLNELTITIIIPHIDNLRLDRAEMYTYANSPTIPFAIGPRIGVSSDPEVPVMFATFLATVKTAYEEQLLTQGPYIAGMYLQNNICDFGIKFL